MSQIQIFFAKYPPDNPLIACFDVVEIRLKVGAESYVNQGKKLSDEFLTMLENAEKGTTITVESVLINGPSGRKEIFGPYTHVKTSPKGKHFKATGPVTIECTG